MNHNICDEQNLQFLTLLLLYKTRLVHFLSLYKPAHFRTNKSITFQQNLIL